MGLNDDGPGVLILSEFAGSAQSLSGAIRVNPWNTEELANAMHQALALSRVERELRQHKLYRCVCVFECVCVSVCVCVCLVFVFVHTKGRCGCMEQWGEEAWMGG